MTRYTRSFLMTSALYLAVGTLIAYQFESDSYSDLKRSDKGGTRVCFSVISREVPVEKEPKKVEEKIAKKVVKKRAEKQHIVKKRETVKKVEKKTEKRVVQKEEPAEVAIPEPIEEVVYEEVSEIIEEEVETETIVEKTAENVQPSAEPTVAANDTQKMIDTQQLQAKQNLFVATLTERINRNKSYPRSARRRGIQGRVEVKFEVCSDGKVENITVVSGKKIFRKSAIKAILRSFPIEVDGKLFDFPYHFDVTLVYSLK